MAQETIESDMKQLSGSELKKKNRIPKGCILLPCLFNFYAKYIMQNSGLSESQAVIKIAGKTINNLRYVYDTTVKEEGEEELKNIFFMTQLSHLYMTTGKTIALTIWTFVSKMISLLFHILSIFFITFFPVSKHLSVSRLQSLSAVILESKKMKSVTVFTFSQSICHEMMGLSAGILVF